MSDSNYWNDKYWPRVMTRRLSRRRLIQIGGMGAAGAMAAAYLGCGGGEQATGDATPSLAKFVSPTAIVYWRRWFGPADAPGQVQWDGKIATLGACAPDKTTVTLNIHESYSDGTAWASDVAQAYIACRVEPFRLLRFDPATNTHTTYAAPTDYNNAWSVCVTGDKVYVPSGGPSDYLNISVFNASDTTPTLVAVYPYTSITLSSNYTSITTDDTYLYVGMVGYVHLIRISDMALVSSVALTHGGNPHAIGYNAADGYCYCSGNPDVVHKLQRSDDTLTEIAHYHHNLVGMTDDVAFSSTHAWFGPEGGNVHGSVMLVPLSTFDSHDLVVCGPTDSYCNGSFIDWDGLHMWTCWYPTTNCLTRTLLSDMTTERLWLADNELAPNEVVQYDTNKYLIVTWGSPGKVINLTNPFPSTALQRPSSGSNYSYWVPVRAYLETTTELTVGTFAIYTDGANGLGTGWTAVGGVATDYAEPTGTEGVSGDVLNTTNYPTLEAAPVDIFGWTSGSPKATDGSLANPDIGDVGVAGTDECFLVLQLVADPAVAPGLSNQETLTITHLDGSAPMSKTASIRGEASIAAVAG